MKIKTKICTACGQCGLENTKEGHDGCLGTIHGVMNACCGHGIEKEAYVQFPNGKCIRGRKATEFQKGVSSEN